MRIISNETEYEAIMKRVDELIEIVDDTTPETDRNYIELDFLADLVVAYEDEHYPIEAPQLKDVISLRMYEMGLTQKTLAEMLEISPSRISEFLNGKSEPTLPVARNLSLKLNIDANIILGV
jgi:HTH-type transcriptional regulator/antitoxin HigA